MKQGVTEWALVTAFLALAAAGAVAIFGDEIRDALGVAPRRGATQAPGSRLQASGEASTVRRTP